MTEVVPIRIPKEVLEKIELLVRLGKYANKSEALRIIIIEHLEERKELLALSPQRYSQNLPLCQYSYHSNPQHHASIQSLFESYDKPDLEETYTQLIRKQNVSLCLYASIAPLVSSL